MALYEYEGKRPRIAENTYVHEYASIVGDVEVGELCFIGVGASLRGDFGSIRVGNRSSVQESCTMHGGPGAECRVGDGCTVGHGAVLHGCTVEDGALVGMNAVVADGSVVGAGSVVAEGAVVPRGTKIPPRKVYAGVPVKEVADVSDAHLDMLRMGNNMYVELSKNYLKTGKRIN